MSGNTSRLGLYLIGGGSSGTYGPDEKVDPDEINHNFELLDGSLGSEQVTSGTRPASPFDGQLISESDTKNTMFWRASSSRWLPVGVPNVAGDTARDAIYPAPVTGDRVYRTDHGWFEEYNASTTTKSDTGSSIAAGWYPSADQHISARVLKSNADASYAIANTWVGIRSNLGWDPVTYRGSASSLFTWTGSDWKALVAGAYEVTYAISGDLADGNGLLMYLDLNSTAANSDTGLLAEATTAAAAGRAGLVVTRRVVLAANDTITGWLLNTASFTVRAARRTATFTSLRYVGPSK